MPITILKNDPCLFGVIPVREEFKHDFVYFGSPHKCESSIEVNKPLFVTPYPGIASIFVDRRNRKALGIPPGPANLHYDEWGLSFEELMEPLKTVHMNVEGIPDIQEHEVSLTGFIHRIDVRQLKETLELFQRDNDMHRSLYMGPMFRYAWMSPTREFLISGIDNIPIDHVTQHTVKYIVKSTE